MPKCKNIILNTHDEECGMPIIWKYEYMKVPAGERNQVLNLDGNPHWPNCRKNPQRTEFFGKEYPVTTTSNSQSMKPEEAKPVSQQPSAVATTQRDNQGFRTIQLTISKGKRINNATHPAIPPYQHRDFFVSRNVAIDNPALDISELIRHAFDDNNILINEQIKKEIQELHELQELQQ